MSLCLRTLACPFFCPEAFSPYSELSILCSLLCSKIEESLEKHSLTCQASLGHSDLNSKHFNFLLSIYLKKTMNWDFPGSPVAKNPHANASGRRFGPWSMEIPHASGQLSPWPATIAVHVPQNPQQEKPLPWEAPTPQLERSPCSQQLDKPCTQRWRPSAAKNKYIKIKN